MSERLTQTTRDMQDPNKSKCVPTLFTIPQEQYNAQRITNNKHVATDIFSSAETEAYESGPLIGISVRWLAQNRDLRSGHNLYLISLEP